MKEKKFDAAQKHFEKKEVELRKRISFLEKQLEAERKSAEQSKERIESLEKENAQMKEWVDRLLQYTELDKKDIKEACEKDKEIANAMKMLGILKGGLL